MKTMEKFSKWTRDLSLFWLLLRGIHCGAFELKAMTLIFNIEWDVEKVHTYGTKKISWNISAPNFSNVNHA